MRIKPLEFLKSVLDQGVFSKPKRLIVYATLAAILAGVIVMFSVPAVARGFSVLFATQGFINEDVETEVFSAMMPQTNCPLGIESCYDPSLPPTCITTSNLPIHCFRNSPLQPQCAACPE